MGGCQLANLSLLHPRLFETLILIDPVIHKKASLLNSSSPAVASARRRDRWPSREEAEIGFKKSKFYQSWDPRVLDRWIQYGLRDAPTKLFPDAKRPEVTLTTTKHQEVMTFLRPNFVESPDGIEPSSAEYSLTNPKFNRRTHPDIIPLEIAQAPFYRAETAIVFNQLPSVRPSVLYMFARHSFLTIDEMIEGKMERTGSGPGGSGGRAEGRVAQVMVEDAGHLIPMEKVEESADHIGGWIGKEMVQYWDGECKTTAEWEDLKGVQRSIMSAKFVEQLNMSQPEKKKADSKL